MEALNLYGLDLLRDSPAPIPMASTAVESARCDGAYLLNARRCHLCKIGPRFDYIILIPILTFHRGRSIECVLDGSGLTLTYPRSWVSPAAR
jgi:hypothetical protein